jgi:site-specific DNA-cytosine methylase
MIKKARIYHFHVCCGLGGGAGGFNDGEARVGNLQAEFVCIGGVDNDPAAIADFKKLTGVDGTLMDLFTREQYIRWHGHEPPAGWRQIMPADLRRAAGNKKPHIVFTSSPCKGLSGLLSQVKSESDKYQALNELTLRTIWLILEAWSDDPVEFILFENVPRIMNRGRYLLDQIIELLRQYGYATAETVHDCGELGELAQTRRRFLLVARHQAKVPAFLYEPPKRPLRGVGEILSKLPMPSDPIAGPMHRLPALHWKTWVRLAFVEAGSDWRSLKRLAVEDGYLRDYLLVPDMHRGALGVRDWEQHGFTVTGTCRSYNGAHNVADPRFDGENYSQFGVKRMDQHAQAVTGQKAPGQGPISVADHRIEDIRPDWQKRFSNAYRVVKFDRNSPAVIAGGKGPQGGHLAVADPRAKGFAQGWGVLNYGDTSGAVAGQTLPSNGRYAVADIRPPDRPLFSKYAVTRFDEKTGTVISGDDSGAYAVSDPRPAGLDNRDKYLTAGQYGVIPWEANSNAIAGSACHDNGYNSVADHRLPAPNERCTPIIISEDNTWHRPFTTLELATLQSLVDPENFMQQLGSDLKFSGNSDSAWRERIGNAVPRKTAAAIASVMGKTLLLAWTGETFTLDSMPVWVQPLVIAVTVDSYGKQGPI